MLLGRNGTSRGLVGRTLRSTAAIGALAALELLALVATRNAWRVVRAPGPASLDEAVVLAFVAACALLGGWIVLGTTVAVIAHLPGQVGGAAQRWSATLAPTATRRLAAVLVGAALGGTLTTGSAMGSAMGSPDHHHLMTPGFAVTHSSAATGAWAPDPAPGPAPGWTPARPAHTPAPVSRLVTSGTMPRAGEIVVHRGDTLWSIARRHLGPGASDAEVAVAWPHWHATNRAVIGPDPDLLLPGQVLRAPEPAGSAGHAVGAQR